MKKIMLLFVLVGILAFTSGCSNKADAVKALTNSGYTNIQTGGHAWFSCGKDDFYSTKFTATNPVGRTVRGAVCSGLFFKGSTIRF